MEPDNAVIVYPSGRLSPIAVSGASDVRVRLQHDRVSFRELQRTRRGKLGVWYADRALFSWEEPNPMAGAVMRRLTQELHLPAYGTHLFAFDSWEPFPSGLLDELAKVSVSPEDAERYERLAAEFQEQWRKLA